MAVKEKFFMSRENEEGGASNPACPNDENDKAPEHAPMLDRHERNRDSKPTYIIVHRGQVIDITVGSRRATLTTKLWRVESEVTPSNRRLIIFKLVAGTNRGPTEIYKESQGHKLKPLPRGPEGNT